MKHQLKCQYCGAEFTAERRNAKYCSDSCRTMASKKRLKQVPSEEKVEERTEKLTLTYSVKELNLLQTETDSANVPLEQFVRIKSLITQALLKENEKKIKRLTETTNKLKVQLSLYTSKPSQGFFIKMSLRRRKQLEKELKRAFPGMEFEEAVEQAAFRYRDDIDLAKSFAEAEAEEKLEEERIKLFEDCSKAIIENIDRHLRNKELQDLINRNK
ncbi:hypothetical protein LA303_08865 [Candidatus Sulfidibacterium hydrothermale]|uniref:hypothetical protein n=1 Tax=Candidatus Sulfidibacterium hydrothermale TaxID=2875962 RepID=UPI001F0AF81A|nr:hypothetical protein [Candidatus Sulfidibacterium hydrothermale]UBM61526.1 hypothetical protein LA303_08865 [Candidatus Sulfidibacterium hydrothermale]